METQEKLMDYILEIRSSLEDIKESYQDIWWEIVGPLRQQAKKLEAEEFLRTAPTYLHIDTAPWNPILLKESESMTEQRNLSQEWVDHDYTKDLISKIRYRSVVAKDIEAGMFYAEYSYIKGYKKGEHKGFYVPIQEVKTSNLYESVDQARGWLKDEVDKLLPLADEISKAVSEELKKAELNID